MAKELKEEWYLKTQWTAATDGGRKASPLHGEVRLDHSSIHEFQDVTFKNNKGDNNEIRLGDFFFFFFFFSLYTHIHTHTHTQGEGRGLILRIKPGYGYFEAERFAT